MMTIAFSGLEASQALLYMDDLIVIGCSERHMLKNLKVPRLSDTRYSSKWRYASSKARLKCATYRRYTDLSVMGVRVGVAQIFF